MTISLAFLAAIMAPVPAPWTLRLLPSAQYPEAMCLDGSRPGYYYRPGTLRGHVKLHFMGGNWCTDPEQCLERSSTFLGSSATWPERPANSTWAPGWDIGADGLMSATDGPLRDWSAVWVMYCDGSSFTSHREAPLLVNQTLVHMRGRKVLDAVLDDLVTTHGLAQAETVLLSGTSSGGMAVFYHAGRVRAKLPATVRLLAAPDAGLFPDAALPPGRAAFRDAIKGLVPFFNISAEVGGGGEYPGTDAGCVEQHAAANETWRCLYAEYALPHIAGVPFFIINSLYDPAAISSIFGVRCAWSPTSCAPQDLERLGEWRGMVTGKVRAAARASARHGVFASTCAQHEETCRDRDFLGIAIEGVAMGDALHRWIAGEPVQLVDRRDLGANPSCWLPSPSAGDDPHGSC